MTKKELLERIAADLRSCADSISAFVQSLPADTDNAADFVPMSETSGFDVHIVPPEDSAPAVTLADVRSCLAELSRAGLADKVRELIHAHGADKLSDVPETEYAALLKETEDLKHGK